MPRRKTEPETRDSYVPAARKPAQSTWDSPVSEESAGGHLASERHYSVAEIAELWGLSERTVKRMFENEPGVLRWGSDERLHKRGYWTIRVPESVLERVHRRLRQTG
jgi:predicted transcriptional regulator